MSDKELNINIRTTADTSGADQTAEAINKTREAAKGAGEGADAINQVTDALNNAKTGAEGAAQAVVKETEAERDNTQATEKNTQSKEKSTSTKRKRKKATKDETKATRDNKKATEDTAQAVDKDTKERTENAAAIDKQGEALEQTGRKGKQAGSAVANGSQQGAAAVKNMGNGALQAAYFFDDLQYGIRGIMNNIPGLVMGFGGGMGLAGALSMAVLAGKVLYDWLGDSADKSDDLAKKMKEHSEEIVDFLRDAEKQRIEFVQGWKRETAANAINQEYEQYVKNITYEYEKQTREIERQLALKKREIARKLDVDTDKNEMQRLNVERQYESGKISKHEKEYKLLLLEQSLDSLIEQARIKTAHAEALALADKQGDAEGKRNSSLYEKGRLENIKISLPNIEEMAGIFKEQSDAKNRIDETNKKLLEAREKIQRREAGAKYAPNATRREEAQKYVKEARDEERRLLAANEAAKKVFDISTSRISKIKEKLEEEQIPFNPSYGINNEGKPVTDKERTKEYVTALKQIDSRQEQLTEAFEKYNDALEKAVEDVRDKEEELANLTAKSSRHDDIKKEAAEVGKIKWKKEEKKEAEKEQKKLDRENERELKRVEREQKQEADKAIKTLVEGLTLNTGKSSTARQAVLVSKALDSIRGDIKAATADGYVDPEEMREIGKLFRAKLEELGISTQRALKGLRDELNQGLQDINNTIRVVNGINREQKNQLQRERLRR